MDVGVMFFAIQGDGRGMHGVTAAELKRKLAEGLFCKVGDS
jgi:hypothetical protein